MLLNKLPCLDKGYVAYIDSTGNSKLLQDVALEFFKRTDGKFLAELSSLTLAVKCPLFLQLHLSQYQFKIITAPGGEPEAYMPNVGEVGSPDHNMAKVIAGDIQQTAEALLINPKAYQMDGCDRFTSQVLTPISTYTTLIIQGSYNEWRRFASQGNLPTGVAPYAAAVEQILQMEWRH